MTASTEQERAEFEAWAIGEGLIVDRNYYGDKERYASITTQSAFRGWQAARRAPVVPQGWKLVPVEPTPAQLLTVYKKTGIARSELQELWNDLLAAASQPPACNPSMQPTADHIPVGQMVAAPVQLPEVDLHSMRAAQKFLDWNRSADGGLVKQAYEYAVFEKVRQLLAAQPSRIAELCAQMCESRASSLVASGQATAANEAKKCASVLRNPPDAWREKLLAAAQEQSK